MFLFYVFPPCIHVCYIHATPVGAKEDISLLGTGVPGGCEPPCRCWEVNPGPLEEHPVLLTSKPSLQPLALILFLNSLILWKNKINCLPFPNLLQSAMERPSLAPSAAPLPSSYWGGRSVECAFSAWKALQMYKGSSSKRKKCTTLLSWLLPMHGSDSSCIFY